MVAQAFNPSSNLGGRGKVDPWVQGWPGLYVANSETAKTTETLYKNKKKLEIFW